MIYDEIVASMHPRVCDPAMTDGEKIRAMCQYIPTPAESEKMMMDMRNIDPRSVNTLGLCPVKFDAPRAGDSEPHKETYVEEPVDTHHTS